MINFGSTTGGKPTYNQKLFYVDYDNDVDQLPTNCAVGSTAYVIQSSDVYKMNSNGEWIKQKWKCASGGTTGGDDSEGEIPWEDMRNESTNDGSEIPWEPMSNNQNDEITWEPMK